MKKILIIGCSLLFVTETLFAQSVGIGTTTPHSSAVLDITHTSKGLLIPRMGTSSLNAVSNPAKGLMIYDSTANQLVINKGTTASPNWQTVSSGGGWSLTGNSGINPALNFIGTTDASPLRFRVNNHVAGHVDSLNENTFMGYRAGTNLTGLANTAIGYKSLFRNTQGSNNVAIGGYSLFSNTAGGLNVAVGVGALYWNQAGSGNAAVGQAALYNNTSGDYNTAMGMNSLLGNSTGVHNTAFGYEALYSNTASNNTAIGSHALSYNTGGMQNTGIGYSALNKNTTGTNNTSTGFQSLLSNTIGDNNAAFGFQALVSNTTGSKNSAFGWQSLLQNTNGLYNAAVGDAALYNNTVGSGNTAMGSGALLSTTGSSYNTAYGFHAGYVNDAGWNNTLIGSECNVAYSGIYNSLAIGNSISLTASNQARIGNSATTSIGGYASWTNLSDGRFKKNVKEDVKGLEFIMKLRPVTYQLDIVSLNKKLNDGVEKESERALKNSIEEKEKMIQTGFVAQEVEAAAKELGYDFSGVDKPKNENDFYGLRYAEFVVPLVKAVQEQQEMIKELKRQNEELRKTNSAQKDINNDLLKRVDQLESALKR